jgi:hypothetical protein
VSQTLNKLVSFLIEERKGTSGAIKEILLQKHPVFTRLQNLLRPGYRVFFTNRDEFYGWLKARGMGPVDADVRDGDSVDEWTIRADKPKYLKISVELFDEDGKLKPIEPGEWNDAWITVQDDPLAMPPVPEDDVPF